MPSIVPHSAVIDTAFLQLSFAIKLWHFLDDDECLISKDAFDIALTIEDLENRVCLPHNEFSTYQDIRLAASNNISICFGAVAITLWEAIRERTGFTNKKLNPLNSYEEQLAALSYMIRCCFAHGTASPIWVIRDKKYKMTYQVGNKTVDLSSIRDGQPFDYASIGGYETLWLLRAEAQSRYLL